MASGMRGARSIALLWTFTVVISQDVQTQVYFNEVTGFSLSPPFFNLAEGSRISATATCGQDETGRPRSDLYCKLVGGPTTGLQSIQGQFCDHCNANGPDKAHPATNAIDGTERWWQSPPLSRGVGYNEVNVTLDLGQLFHVAYVLIKFANSPRPDLWVLERSLDHGRTYVPWQYFAHSKRECIERFGKEPNARIVRDDDQICTTEYSRIVPLENGEVVVSLVNSRPGAKNFTYSPVLRDFTKATNIRLRFLRTSTLLGHLISKAQRDPTVTRRYYYSIKDISVGGRCVCHGHAQMCGGRNADNPNRLQCECKHNTCGESCDRCCPGYQQKAWRPATADSPNECQPCQCHSHATDCAYDPEVERRRASLDTFGRYDGGGVCINCQHNTAGVNCERCTEGFYRPFGAPPESPTGCIPCRCDSRTTSGCEMGSGRCVCRPQFTAENCDRCADGYSNYPQCIRYPIYQPTTKAPAGHIVEPTSCPLGYFGPPSCQQCLCDHRGSTNDVCDASGRCLCRQGVEGVRCDRCWPGYHSFPNCQECRCDGAGVADRACGQDNQCRCLESYAGPRCDQCAPGYYGYPDCAACQCSREGSYDPVCNPLSGQCLCLPGVLGQRCDRCADYSLRFPHCSAAVSHCNPAGSEVTAPETGLCSCLPNVEGVLCDACKPLYWNLSPENPGGCTECRCDLKGTLSGVGECQQKKGQCYCKPNTCGHACGTCEDDYFLLQKRNYLGCQGCQCDVGGAMGGTCDEASGQCRCRKHVAGRTCTEPAANFYFPSLHQMKFEVEDGISPNGRRVRFGYDPREFPDFSWSGYAVMSPAQPEVILSLAVGFPGPFHIAVRYATSRHQAAPRVKARILVVDQAGSRSCCDWSGQSQEVVFPPSRSPAFLTVPGDGFAEPFSLSPGKWIIHIRAQGVLLDYLVLLPRDYYEAPLLQEKITQPCTYTSPADRDKNCLLYKHVALDGFSSVLGSQGELSSRNRRRRNRGKRLARLRRPTAEHPDMALLTGRQAQLLLSLRVPRPGAYTLVLEYASEVEAVQNVNLLISQQPNQARANINSCAYSFLCRSVAIDGTNQVAVFQLTHKVELLLQISTASFLLHKVYAVPAEEFSMEYVDPRVLCISVHGRFTEDSQHCVPSQYDRPAGAWLLDAARDGRPSSARVGPSPAENEEWRRRRQSGVFPLPAAQPSGGVLLKSPQTEVSFRTRVPLPGRYVVVVHYRQPEHPSFPVEVRMDAGRTWIGSVNASFCPRVSGCREVVVAQQRIAFDFDPAPSRQEPTISVLVPPGKTLTLDYILLVGDSSYTPDLLKEKPLDKSSDFLQRCRGEAFYIDPRTSPQFCRDSARSLVAAYNGGALPCDCDKSGAMATACDPMGGQCSCRPHVIGRQCTRCATGFYGFPYCRACECGLRLCDAVTGQCICPPQTVKPACEVCESQTFSYHPLLGCDGCDCSPNGIQTNAGAECHHVTGQCTCKPRIGGRQCARCAPGYYGFPECQPCDCAQGGVTPDLCDPATGSCLCKRNVGGGRCEVCRDDSFHFDPSNPLGCTSCFCFQATDQCQSSEKRRGKFVDMRGWRLEKADQDVVPSVLNPSSGTLVADIQELPAAVHLLHWVAPPSYLGDRVSSYGGYLTYHAKSFGIPSEGMVLLDRQPDVVLSGHDMTLVHQATKPPSPDRLHQGRVQLLEGNWRHAVTNRPVSRDELMMVLAVLAGLRVRALYFTQSHRLSLGEVGLEVARDTGPGGQASTVEDCACPPHYTGNSCQRCAPGYYREASGFFFLGRCVACDCNGLTDQCEERTGKCQNCKYNTDGDSCERCREGYYGNPAERSCRVCPCPFGVVANSFAVGCREGSAGLQCMCKQGYSGDKCERCAPGYYGNPLATAGSCRPCNCKGNGNNCDSKTGVCRNPLPKDTNTDEQCQECDNCAQTLLSDLEKLDEELARIKAELDSASASAGSQDRLKKLEKAIADTKTLVNKFSATVNSQEAKVDQLEDDSRGLSDDISDLKDKANERAKEAQKVLDDVGKTHQNAKDLNIDAQSLLQKIRALLDQLTDSTSNGNQLPSEDAAKLLKEAQRMVKEMEQRNFNPQKTAAEKEKEAAQKLLEDIRANVSKQCDQNQEAAEKIRGRLTNYQAKLKDLEDALKKAGDLVKKANRQNGLNADALEDLLKHIEDLKKERQLVKDQIALAEDQLQGAEDLLRMLDDSKTAYEQLAAQLDGARGDLIKRVNQISRAAAQEDMVRRAEEHAKNLNKLATELQEAVSNSSGRTDVREAMNAIDAYKNITDAVNAAEAAANQAKAAADKALEDVKKEDLAKRAKELKDTGSNLLKDAKEADQDLKAAADDLAEQRRRLKNAEKKKKALEKDLLDARTELNNIKRDDIGDMIDEAKRKAASANDSASGTMDKLNDIKKDIEKININPVDSNISKVMEDVDKSVKDLLNTIPSLQDKISEVEGLSSQLSPGTNVTENIKRIKELIEQARDAANRVVVPMKFTGLGHVELRPPRDLEDLKAYTTLSLTLHRPEDTGRGDGIRRRRQTTLDNGNMFVLYIGNKEAVSDYIGMVLKDNVLYCIYKLNGEEYTIKTDAITRSKAEQAYFDKVEVHRIYQDAEVIITKLFTSNNPDPPVKKALQGQLAQNLLDLNPSNVVFYVGGYPDDFTPPASLNYPKYKGCIELSTFNDRFISLYNFQKAVEINLEIPCRRYILQSLSSFFEGTGFAKVAIANPQNNLIIVQTITTRSENGLILYIGNEEKHYYVTMERGFVVMHSNLFAEPVRSKTKVFPTTAESSELFFIMDSGREEVMVRLSGAEVAPRQVELNRGSSLSAAFNGFSLANDVTVSLGFKSTENQGVLFQNRQAAVGVDLTLENGYVFLTFSDQVWRSNKQYQDGKWHYVTATKTAGRIQLRVDEVDEGQQQSSSTFTSSPGPDTPVFLGNGTFKGCISNLYTRRPASLYTAEDLSRFTSVGDVLLDECSADRLPELMRDRTVLEHGYKIGGAVSSLSYKLPLQALLPKPHFSLDLRTRSAEGLLFFAATRGGRSHLALYMSKGRIRLSVGKQREIFNREKYNDGKWHSVIFSLERKKFRLVVDGIRAQDGQMTNDEVTSMEMTSPLYLGSAPESLYKELKRKSLPKQSAVGCVRNFKMNGTPMPEPTSNHGAGPCFDGPTQGGAYFSGRGAHVILNDSFVVGSSFELLMDIRPRSLTGVLLHVAAPRKSHQTPSTGHHLSLYMLNGEVVAIANNGAGDFKVSVRPKTTLCDGTFHKVYVIKKNNVIQLNVDTVGNYKIGPPSSSTTLTKDPLHLGGIPEVISTHPSLPVSSSFAGCVRDTMLNGEPVFFEKLPGVFGAVNLRECPVG
ncbi:laminin subunit alpha-3-like [Aplochiton taeniatus]